MFYRNLKELKPEKFKRLTGIKPELFQKMLQALRETQPVLKTNRGRSRALSLEDELLLTLKFWREYPTAFSLAHVYEVSEQTVENIIARTERAVAKRFKLPGKKKFLDSDMQCEVVLVDATESPIERPKGKGKKRL